MESLPSKESLGFENQRSIFHIGSLDVERNPYLGPVDINWAFISKYI